MGVPDGTLQKTHTQINLEFAFGMPLALRNCVKAFAAFACSLVVVARLAAQSPSVPAENTALPSNPSPPAAVPAVPAQPPKLLTLDEAVAMAERQHPRLHEAAAATARAQGAARAAKAYSNPSVEVFEGEQYARDVPMPGVPGLLQHYAAYQPVEVPLERRTRIRAAQLATESSRYREAGAALSVAADAKHAFYDVLRRRAEVKNAKANLRLVVDLRKRVQAEVDAGEKGRLELTRAEAEVGRARFAVRTAQIELANATALLRAAIDAPADENLQPEGALKPRIALPPLSALREKVLRTHPALAQSKTDAQAAKTELAHEQALRIPQPTLFAEFENQPDQRYWRAGVSIPLPLWNRRRGEIDEARAAISQSNAVLDSRRLQLVSATERAYEQYQLADQQVTSLQSGELHAAESAVNAAKAAYRFGERGIVEVLDAQRVLQSVRGDLLSAQYARQSALIDLEELGAVAPGGKS